MRLLKLNYCVIYCCCIFSSNYFSAQEQNLKEKSQNKTNTSPAYSFHLFNVNNGWGYDINVNNQPYIRQNVIPNVEGNKAFATKEDAQKVAKLIIEKLKNNPDALPTVSINELESLKIKR